MKDLLNCRSFFPFFQDLLNQHLNKIKMPIFNICNSFVIGKVVSQTENTRVIAYEDPSGNVVYYVMSVRDYNE